MSSGEISMDWLNSYVRKDTDITVDRRLRNVKELDTKAGCFDLDSCYRAAEEADLTETIGRRIWLSGRNKMGGSAYRGLETAEQSDKWRPGSTALFIIIVCGSFWALLISAFSKWLY